MQSENRLFGDLAKLFNGAAGTIAGMSREAEAGSIRGDFAISGHKNIIHASDSPENAELEIKNFFKEDEIFEYDHLLLSQVYGPEDLE